MRHFIALILMLIAIAATVRPSAADGTTDWPGYVWAHRTFEYCPGQPDPSGNCLAFNLRWDAGREQYINFWYRIDGNSGAIKIIHSLYNNDHLDGDTVCVTVLWSDAQGRSIFVFHQRWGINARFASSSGVRRIQEFNAAVPPDSWRQARTVSLGYKQCQSVDDAQIARAAITGAVVICSAYTGNPQGCAQAGQAALGIVEGRDVHIQPED